MFTSEVSPSRPVTIIYLRGFSPQGFIFAFEVSPSRLLLLFTFEVLPSRFLFTFEVLLKVVIIIYLRGFALKVVRSLPLAFRPQGCYNYLPSRFRPQGCFIFAFEVSPSKLFLFLRLRPLCLLGIYRGCWCVDSLSDMACPCPFTYLHFIYLLTVSKLSF